MQTEQEVTIIFALKDPKILLLKTFITELVLTRYAHINMFRQMASLTTLQTILFVGIIWTIRHTALGN